MYEKEAQNKASKNLEKKRELQKMLSTGGEISGMIEKTIIINYKNS